MGKRNMWCAFFAVIICRHLCDSTGPTQHSMMVNDFWEITYWIRNIWRKMKS